MAGQQNEHDLKFWISFTVILFVCARISYWALLETGAAFSFSSNSTLAALIVNVATAFAFSFVAFVIARKLRSML